MLLFQSIPSCTHAQGERAGYIFIYILDFNYVFTPPKTSAKYPQQQVNAPSMLSGDCLHILLYQKYPLHIPPSHPAPSAYQPSYLPNQKTLLLILTSPGTTAILLFFGWWEIPSMDL